MDAQTEAEADRTANGSDQPDLATEPSSPGVKPWTIKGIPPETRNAAIAAAERDHQTLGEWFTRAIPAIIQYNRQQNRLPVPVDQPVRPSDPEADLAEIERLMGVVKDLHGVTSAPPPKRLTALAYSLVSARLKTIKGGKTEPAAKSDRTASQADQDAVGV
jgi:hypothetical protein